MLIRVLYSDGQMLLCNADCVSANLLQYIRKSTGNIDREIVDLADETGLVLELSDHKMEQASKHLAHKGDKFILVEKKLQQQQQAEPTDAEAEVATPAPAQQQLFDYLPLLTDCEELYPDIKFRSVAPPPPPPPRSPRTPQAAADASKESPKTGKKRDALLKPGEAPKRVSSASSAKGSTTSVAGKGKKK